MLWKVKALVIYSSSFFVSFVVFVILWGPPDHKTSSVEQLAQLRTVKDLQLLDLTSSQTSVLTTPSSSVRHTERAKNQFKNGGSISYSLLKSNFTQPLGESTPIFPSTFPVTMPFYEYVKDTREVEKSGWVTELRGFLQALDKRDGSSHVNVVFGDFDHRLLVLNWVAAALVNVDPPLRNVLVLSLDLKLCRFLTSRDLPVTCIAVPVESLFSLPGGGGGRKRVRQWRMGMMVRLPIVRLISYWGYDVASYDSDAVPLGNPRRLYQQRPDVHLFSSAGTFPPITSKRWGFTLCAGTLFIRASQEAEVLWEYVSAVAVVRDEQLCLNQALEDMNVVWNSTNTSVTHRCEEREGWAGEGFGGVHVFVFPPHISCRRDCCKSGMSRQELYLVHPFSVKKKISSKVASLKRMNAWFLGEDDK